MPKASKSQAANPPRNEVSGPAVKKLAALGAKFPARLTLPEVAAVCASVLTQSADKKKT